MLNLINLAVRCDGIYAICGLQVG